MIEFFVPGTPQPGGSKRALHHKHSGQILVLEDNLKTKGWRSVVVDRAFTAMRGRAPLTGPVWLSIIFYMPRLKSHYGTGVNTNKLKTSAPRVPITKPDGTKLLRSTEDALKGICWRDDSQVVEQHIYRRYAERPGADIRITIWPDVREMP